MSLLVSLENAEALKIFQHKFRNPALSDIVCVVDFEMITQSGKLSNNQNKYLILRLLHLPSYFMSTSSFCLQLSLEQCVYAGLKNVLVTKHSHNTFSLYQLMYGERHRRIHFV